MVNVVVSGLSENAVNRIDAASESLGLSRNEYLRRALEYTELEIKSADTRRTITPEDWQRSAENLQDLANEEIMDHAWR